MLHTSSGLGFKGSGGALNCAVLKEVELQGTFFVTANDPQRGSLAAFQVCRLDCHTSLSGRSLHYDLGYFLHYMEAKPAYAFAGYGSRLAYLAVDA